MANVHRYQLPRHGRSLVIPLRAAGGLLKSVSSFTSSRSFIYPHRQLPFRDMTLQLTHILQLCPYTFLVYFAIIRSSAQRENSPNISPSSPPLRAPGPAIGRWGVLRSAWFGFHFPFTSLSGHPEHSPRPARVLPGSSTSIPSPTPSCSSSFPRPLPPIPPHPPRR